MGKVIISEVFRHPSQAEMPSFPARADDGFRPYVKDSMLKYELDDDEDEGDELGYHSEWVEEIEPLLDHVPSAEKAPPEVENEMTDMST